MSQPASRKRAEARFYGRYGKALSYWADLELVLSEWFASLCDPGVNASYEMAQVFYSAKSFSAMQDMLRAAFYAKRRDEGLSEFFEAAMRKAKTHFKLRVLG